MVHVNITVNGRTYKMACREGEEARIQAIALEIDGLCKKLKGRAKSVQDDRLFLMAAIVMTDQFWEARDELQKGLKQISEFRSYHVIDGGATNGSRDQGRATIAG